MDRINCEPVRFPVAFCVPLLHLEGHVFVVCEVLRVALVVNAELVIIMYNYIFIRFTFKIFVDEIFVVT